MLFNNTYIYLRGNLYLNDIHVYIMNIDNQVQLSLDLLAFLQDIIVDSFLYCHL